MAGYNFPATDYTPQLAGYTGQGTFRFWCQKVLPLVYDDSLSYYELLCKVVEYLNNTIKDVSTLEDNLQTAWNYILSLKWVDGLVDDKLNKMVEDGTLIGLILSVTNYRDSFRVNVADFADGELTGENMSDAIHKALEASKYLYIPMGTYAFNCTIEEDCDILLDAGCHIGSNINSPSLLFKNSRVTVCGGYLEAGENNNGNYYSYDDPNWEDIPGYEQHGGVGLLEFRDCNYVHVNGCSCRWNQFPFAVLTMRCNNVLIENCHFMNVLHAAIGHYVQGNNIVYRNIYIKNIRKAYHQFYCYGIVISTMYAMHDTEHIFEPPSNVTFTHCYIENSPDQAIDTHGSRNTTIDSNVFINTATAITCYNDCRRVPRPDGWIMTGSRISNNYAKSSVTGVYIDENGDDRVAHPFVFIGSANERNTDLDADDPDEPDGKFTDFTGCVIENNYFESANDYMTRRHSSGSKSRRLLSFNNIASNVVFRNNFVKYTGSDSLKIPFALHRHYNITIESNIFQGFGGTVSAYGCTGVLSNNAGFYYNINENGFTHFVTPTPYCYPWLRTGVNNVFAYGEMMLENGHLEQSLGDGLCARKGHYPATPITATVSNGVVVADSYLYLPGMALTATKDGVETWVWVIECVDFHRFIVVDGSRHSLPDGEYEFRPIEAVSGPTVFIMKNQTTTTSVNVRDKMSSGEVIGSLPSGSNVVSIGGDENNTYIRCIYTSDGIFKTGYISKSALSS